MRDRHFLRFCRDWLRREAETFLGIDQSGIEAYLITGNYEAVHSTCGNIGSIIHRLGRPYYAEARRWLLLSVAVGRWMRVGRDDAHVEMILGKIYVEFNNRYRPQWLLKRAERIAERAGNLVSLADIRMVWGSGTGGSETKSS